MNKSCEYCGASLPEAVDKESRRVRSFHFESCEARLHQKHTAARQVECDKLAHDLSRLTDVGFTDEQADVILSLIKELS
jgi:hypothetical protein